MRRTGAITTVGKSESLLKKMKNNKSLGQHWLNNREILDYIADEASASESPAEQGKKPLCVEIGPGLGTLTSSLLKRFEKVIAVEFDDRLAANLPGSFPGTNLEVVNTDFLKYDLESVPAPYIIAGNIPYYITSPIIEHILMAKNQPERAVLLMQKEVAERIVDEKETVLSLKCKNRAKVKLGAVVGREEFTPPPKVDSQVLILEPHAPEVDEAVFKIIALAFSSPRKKLLHNLLPLKSKNELIEIFSKEGISRDARPADLHLKDYERLFKSML